MVSTETVIAFLRDPLVLQSGGSFDRRKIIIAANRIGPPMKLLYWRRLEQLGYLPDFSSSNAEDALQGIQRFGAPQVEIFFVSHRWLRPSTDASLAHPDDEASTKAKALVEFSTWRRDWVRRRHGFLPEIYFWIDYCCFDQGNSSINMAMLPIWIASCERVLCIETHDYHERAWCRLELLLSYAFNFSDHYTVIDPAFQASASHDGREETHILKRPIVGCLTDPSDAKHIEALEQLACGFQPASIDRVSGRRLPLAEFDTTPVRCYRL